MEKCDTCGKEFSTAAALAQHMKDKHGMEAQSSSPQAGQGKAAQKSKPKSLRKRNRHPRLIAGSALVVVGLIGLYFVVAPSFAQPPFPCAAEGSWIHVHPYVTIDIQGQNISLAQGIGLLNGGTCAEPVHTHDGSGLLHIELSQADAKTRNYTLGDFFKIWNFTAAKNPLVVPKLNGVSLPVEFSPTSLMGFHTNSTYHVVLLVDGQPSTEWGSLNLEHLNYCSDSSTGAPCFPTDCSSVSSCSGPLWEGGTTDPWGSGHTVVLEYVKS